MPSKRDAPADDGIEVDIKRWKPSLLRHYFGLRLNRLVAWSKLDVITIRAAALPSWSHIPGRSSKVGLLPTSGTENTSPV